MTLPLHGAAARLRRSTLPLAAASAFALSALGLPAGAQAADSLGAGGVVANGSALTVGVSGAAGTAGSVEARFSGVGTPLFAGDDNTNMNDGTAAVFALNTPTGLFSAQVHGQDNSPFTQTSAPVKTGTGTVGDPFVITSHFDATASIHITQTVTHVSGTTKFVGTWAIQNGSGSTTAMQAFEGADLYVNGNDNGTGTFSGTSPNRVIGSVASDGTQGQILEQAGAPWTHYFSGMSSLFRDATGDSTFGSFPDTVDPTIQNSGEAVEWDYNLGAGATKTVSIAWSFTHPAAPQAPRITNTTPAASSATTATTASMTFGAAVGDTSNAVSFECSLDGAAFAACTTPKALSGLADGSHTFSVRALNSAADPGPQTDRTWTVDTTPPAAPTLGGAPTGTVAVDHASLTLAGEAGATFRCSVDGGSFVGCSSPLVLSGLADGNHTVSVKQVDAAGNTGVAVASASWTVDTSVPAAPVDVNDPADTVATTASLAFTTPAGLSAECSLDAAPWLACTSPVAVANLGVGSHTMSVRMVNGAGTVGSAQTVTWDVTAPVVAAPVITAPVVTAPVVTATPAATTTAPAAKPTAAIVPTACVSRRSVSVHWDLPGRAKVKGFKVMVDGKVVKRLSAKARTFTIALAGRPAATVKVQVKAIGKDLATTRVYKTCTAGRAGAAELATVLLKRSA